jgi:hypothetical protein
MSESCRSASAPQNRVRAHYLCVREGLHECYEVGHDATAQTGAVYVGYLGPHLTNTRT